MSLSFSSTHLHLAGIYSSREPFHLLERTSIAPSTSSYGPIMATVIVEVLSFVSLICHTLPACWTVLCPEQVNRNCSCECLRLLLSPAHSLPCSLPFKPCITPIFAGWCFYCCQHPAFHSYATWQKVVHQHVLGAFSPHGISCVYLKIGGFNY